MNELALSSLSVPSAISEGNEGNAREYRLAADALLDTVGSSPTSRNEYDDWGRGDAVRGMDRSGVDLASSGSC